MPVIRLEFDNERVSESEARSLSEGIQKIVSEVTNIEDVFVFANSAQIKVHVHPIEIFVEMSAHKISDVDALLQRLSSQLAEWKIKTGFPHPINLTLDPKPWKFEIGV